MKYNNSETNLQAQVTPVSRNGCFFSKHLDLKEVAFTQSWSFLHGDGPLNVQGMFTEIRISGIVQ